MEEVIIEYHYRITQTTHPIYPLNDEYYTIYCKFLPKYSVSEQFLNLYKDTLYLGIDLLYYYCCRFNNDTLLIQLIKLFNYTIPSFYSMYNPIEYCIKNGLCNLFLIFYEHFKLNDLHFYITNNAIKHCILNGHYNMILCINQITNNKYISNDFLYYYLISSNHSINEYIQNYYNFNEIYQFISNYKLFCNHCIIDNIFKLEYFIDYQYPLFINESTLLILYQNFLLKHSYHNISQLFKKICKYLFETYSFNQNTNNNDYINSITNHFIINSLKYYQMNESNELFLNFVDIILQCLSNQQSIEHLINMYIKYCILFNKYYHLYSIYNSPYVQYINTSNILVSNVNIHHTIICNNDFGNNVLFKNKETNDECIIQNIDIKKDEIYLKCKYHHVISKEAYYEYLKFNKDVYKICCMCKQPIKNKIYIQTK